MMTEQFPEADGRAVWLDRGEVDRLLATDALDEPRRKVAVRLGAECGLRSDEIVDVASAHIYTDDTAGRYLKVPEGKTDYREVPIPEGLANLVDALGHSDPDKSVVDRSTRQMRNWLADARDELVDDDERWRFVSPHDLRRTWAGWLSADDVEVGVALRWGGWNDLDTFLRHYRSNATAKAQAKERAKVPWL